MNEWEKAQEWEALWHSLCLNSYGEEEKQLIYARKMGLEFYHNGKSPYNINLKGKSIVDIGGGPYSLLLKCQNRGRCTVVDPLAMPEWVEMRYACASIALASVPAERWQASEEYDEAWIYNCLQHTIDPRTIIENARRAAGIIRIFEWIDTAVNEGHPHTLTAEQLDTWLSGEGKVETLNLPTLKGKCYYGIFPGSR